MFFLLQVLAVLAVVFGVAAVLTGRADGMSDEPQDLANVGIPRDRAMTPDDVIGLRFALALRGYRMDEVDDALDRLAAEIAARDEAINRLRGELEAAQAGGSGEELAGTATDVTDEDRYAAFAPPRDEEPEPPVPDPYRDPATELPAAPAAPEVPAAPAAPEVPAAAATPPPLPSTAPAWATERRGADDYVASDATGEVSEGTPVDVPTTPEGWQELDPTIATDSGPAAPEFTEPASPFRPEVPDIAYDPWSVTPRSRYTDGPTYVEVDHDDEDDGVELGEHHTGYAPPPPGGEGAPIAEETGGNDASDLAAAEQAVEDARTGALGGGDLPGAGGVAGASEGASEGDEVGDEEPAAPPRERPWQS